MSYILDALKRSDRERREGKIPDLDSVHVAPVAQTQSRFSNSALVLMVVLLGNVVFAGLWVYESMRRDSDHPQVIAGSPDIGALPQARPTVSVPVEPDGRFGQPLPRPEPSNIDQWGTVDPEAGAAIAAYLLQQGIGQPSGQPAQQSWSATAGVGTQGDARIQGRLDPTTIAPRSQPRSLPHKLEALSPANDPYASLFEKDDAVTSEGVVSGRQPDPIQARASHAASGRRLTADQVAAVQANAEQANAGTRAASTSVQPDLSPGDEIIRPSVLPADTAESGARIAPGAGTGIPSGRDSPDWQSVPLIDDLPEIVRNELPEMDFNSHMFSSDPRFRTVMINGKSLRENDLVDTRTRVMKITEVGVILQFDELRFRVAVLDGWGQ
jgi:general secretion pathway protein B